MGGNQSPTGCGSLKSLQVTGVNQTPGCTDYTPLMQQVRANLPRWAEAKEQRFLLEKKRLGLQATIPASYEDPD
jgi:hypothetical protein